MNPCENCRQQLLPFLYDLLEMNEVRQVQSHLASCPACAAALEQTRGQKRLLQEAARETFPEVSFAPPTGRQRIAPPIRQPRPWKGRLLWAASLLLLCGIGTGSGLVGWFHFKNRLGEEIALQDKARTSARELEIKIAAARTQNRKDIDNLNGQINQLFGDWNNAREEKRRSLQERQVDMVVTGPGTIQAGAPNSLQIKMNLPDAGKGAQASLRVVSEKSKTVLFEKKIPAGGPVQVSLPASMPVKAQEKLTLEVASLNKDVPAPDRLVLERLRYLTHLATDRPMYRPGDTVYFRSLTLERFSLQPSQEDLHLRFRINDPLGTQIFFREGQARVVQENGKEVQGPDGQPLHGLATGQFPLARDLPGGTYTLTVSEAHNRFPPEQRTFTVNQWQPTRINKELTFHRKSYGPGETVTIHARANYVEGEPFTNGQVNVSAQVDQTPLPPQSLIADRDGKVTISLSLPLQIEKGQGSVSLTFRGQGPTETIVRPLPIVTNRLHVEFFPEGGDLVAGTANRVYFQVRNTLDRPADVRGRVVDQDGQTVAQAQTLTDDQEPGINQGMGIFSFTPQTNGKYRLLIDSPVGIQGDHWLPSIKPQGVVLQVPQGVVEQTIQANLVSVGKERNLLVGAYCRGGLLDQVEVRAPADQATAVTLKTAPGVSGVYRLTVFEILPGEENSLVPVAERLVYRQATQKLNIGIRPDQKIYQPGQAVQLGLETTNEKRSWTPAVLMVAVVDKALLSLADEKTFRSLPTHFLLTTEVRKAEDLEYADFLLGAHSRAAQALDLLLGTQGWRRFAEQDPIKFVQKDPREQPDAQKLLLAMGNSQPETTSLREQVYNQIDRQYGQRFLDLQKQLAEKEKNQEGPQEMMAALGKCVLEMNQREPQVEEARYQLHWYERFLTHLGSLVFILGVLAFGIVLLVWGTKRLNRGQPAYSQFFLGGAVLALLLVVSLVGMIYLIANEGHDLQLDPLMAHRGGRWAAPMTAPPSVAKNSAEAKKAEIVREMDDLKADFAEMPKPGMEAAPVPERRPADLLELARARLPRENLDGEGLRKQGIQERQLAKRELAEPMPGAPPPGDFQARADRDLRRQGNFQEILRARLGRKVNLPLELDSFILREYAHHHPVQPDGTRRDFSELLCWQPALVSADGKASLRFDLSDATTQFQVLVFGHTLDGRLGAGTFDLTSRLPFSIEPQVPIEVTSSDRVQIPVAVTNNSPAQTHVRLKLEGKGLKQPQDQDKDLVLEAGQRGRVFFPVNPGASQGTLSARVIGQFDKLGVDKVERTFKVVPEGFPVEGAQSGLLEKTVQHDLHLPDSWVPGTLQAKVQVFPSVLADLQKGLEGLLREPCGCFEQSSSSNYPNVMILNYLKETNQGRPEIEQQSRRLMQSGYQKLTAFECIKEPGVRSQESGAGNQKQGYEWFGGTAPPHEALTAYGLLQFSDMARVYPVDEEMIRRTRAYLLAQRDGQGGFRRNSRAVDSFGRAPDHITNAYIVWALTSTANTPLPSGERGRGEGASQGEKEDLQKEIDALLKKAAEVKDPYFLALVSLILLNVNRTKEALDILNQLKDLQKKEGQFEGTQTSITGSGGLDLQVETTALVILGWLQANRPDQFQINLNRAIHWLSSRRSGQGSFGATQSTILALKALVAHTRANRQAIQAGEIQVIMIPNGGVPPGGIPDLKQNYPAGMQDPITIQIPENVLDSGSQKIVINNTGANNLPYTLTWSYQALKPANPENCPVHLATELSTNEAKEGETVRLHAVVENKSGKGQGMTVAILGLPAGLILPEDLTQLKDLARTPITQPSPPGGEGKRAGVISAFEIRGRELVLYWRDLAPAAKIELDLDLICRIPGQFRGPAGRAYLYYTPQLKFWTEPLSITIRE